MSFEEDVSFGNDSSNLTLDTGVLNRTYSEEGLPYEVSNWSLEQKVGIMTGFILLIMFTILGNSSIIAAVLKDPGLQASVTNLFYLNLALADLLVGLLVVPLMTLFVYEGYWPLGNVLCDIWLCVDFLCCTASFYTLTAISWDRYRAVSNPFSHLSNRSRRRVVYVLLGVWIVAALVWVPAIFVVRALSADDIDYYCLYLVSKEYVIVSCVIAYYIPMTAMLTLYALIYKNIRQAMKIPLQVDTQPVPERLSNGVRETCSGEETDVSISVVSLSVTSTAQNGTSSLTETDATSTKQTFGKCKQDSRAMKQRRATLTLGVVMLVFLICWLPWTIIWPLDTYWPSVIPQWLYDVSAMAAYINSLINPFLYVFSNPTFRNGIRRLWARGKSGDGIISK